MAFITPNPPQLQVPIPNQDHLQFPPIKIEKVNPIRPLPAFGDITKAANDLLKKDFYHSISSLFEVKLKVPNEVSVTTRGTTLHDGTTSALIEARKSVGKGVTTTFSATTSNVLSAKVELDNVATDGLKTDITNNYHLEKGLNDTKVALYLQRPAVHARAFVDYSPTGGALKTLVDAVVGHDGLLIGAEAAYNIQKAAITQYGATIGYNTPQFNAALTASDNMNLIQAMYYQRVNSNVEAGVRALYNIKTAASVGIEIASKYRIDPYSFAKIKLNDHGIASLSYNTRVNSAFTFGIGTSFNPKKFGDGSHKIGASFSFSG